LAAPLRIMTRRLTLRMPGTLPASESMHADHGPWLSKSRSTVTALDATSGPVLEKDMFLVTVCGWDQPLRCSRQGVGVAGQVGRVWR